ncbi:Acg family FMN-binding oxidoreductase [Natrinema halophilum]|uniref:Nitroreductase n=1 Tax=Natrinema halophilum TaxID=1699371 RepID=A0A7D5GMA7_9EURY|nr:nitroreductase [Natrinema halophilum]QLG50590.1 nitroreductase [Natrinema halophilum]
MTTQTRREPDSDEFPADAALADQAAFLLRYAILAPSSHNSQPWTFAVVDGEIRIYADESRRLSIADPDGRELDVSVGCALENLLVAIEHFGLGYSVEYAPDNGGQRDGEDPDGQTVPGATKRAGAEPYHHAATVTVEPTSDNSSSRDPVLFDAITERRTNHRPFTDRAIPQTLFDRFETCVTGEQIGIEFVTDSSVRSDIAALQTRADERQFANPDYRAELGRWIGSGALGANWLTARIGQLAVRHLDIGEREGQKDSTLLTSAPAIAVVTAERDTLESRLRVGQTFERIALLATIEGLAVHPMSQILEVPAFSEELTAIAGLTESIPLHLFRLGYAESDSTRTPRRPLEDMLR